MPASVYPSHIHPERPSSTLSQVDASHEKFHDLYLATLQKQLNKMGEWWQRNARGMGV